MTIFLICVQDGEANPDDEDQGVEQDKDDDDDEEKGELLCCVITCCTLQASLYRSVYQYKYIYLPYSELASQLP